MLKKIKFYSALVLTTMLPFGVNAADNNVKNYMITIMNHHTSRIENINSQPEFKSSQCKLMLNKYSLEPGEIAVGQIAFDSMNPCDIEWGTIGGVDHGHIKYLFQKIFFNETETKMFCENCSIKKVNDFVVIEQKFIQETA